MRDSFVRVFGLALVLIALVAAPAFAQDPEPSDDEVNRIAKQLYCPVCPNTPLDVCSTQACAQWRATIREQLELGWNEDQIRQYFVEQYGDRVLATPPARGINWLIYVLPPVVIIVGGLLLLRTIRSWIGTNNGRLVQEELLPEKDVYVNQLEDELRRRESG
ncbi:MAG: cytochrome c-type biogenesis protein CcmH [Chloroflexi bacterium]|nr:cytochrome c-type biogenesis protein CcmH [Chloroflexota bacterium]